MGQNTKLWFRQMIMGAILALITASVTGYIVSQKTAAVNDYRVKENAEQIRELKANHENKADKTMVFTIKTDLNNRLDRIESKLDRLIERK